MNKKIGYFIIILILAISIFLTLNNRHRKLSQILKYENLPEFHVSEIIGTKYGSSMSSWFYGSYQLNEVEFEKYKKIIISQKNNLKNFTKNQFIKAETLKKILQNHDVVPEIIGTIIPVNNQYISWWNIDEIENGNYVKLNNDYSYLIFDNDKFIIYLQSKN